MTLNTNSGTIVVGIDTHKDTHHAVVLDGDTGRLVADASFPATPAGNAHLLSWAVGHGTIDRIGMEGTASYGTALARYLTGSHLPVFEVPPGDRALRRVRGKTDRTDAEAAARRVLADPNPSIPKQGGGTVDAIRYLYVARKLLVKQQTEIGNQIGQLLITAPENIRQSYTTGTPLARTRRLAGADATTSTDTVETVVLKVLADLAARWLELRTRTRELATQVSELIQHYRPQLLDAPGIGGICAADLLIAVGQNSTRIHSEAALAKLFGAAPIPASSGQTNRHRISRGGNRDANAALYRIVITRLAHDPRTRDYRDRHLTTGKTTRDIIRLLKRALCRELYPLLCTT